MLKISRCCTHPFSSKRRQTKVKAGASCRRRLCAVVAQRDVGCKIKRNILLFVLAFKINSKKTQKIDGAFLASQHTQHAKSGFLAISEAPCGG